MPELPEVQTIINDLNKKIKGDTIVGFWSDWKKTIKKMSGKQFEREVIGRRILKARRIGKNIFIDLSGEKTLYIHLKMTGHLLIKNQRGKSNFFEDRVNQYIHHIWKLKSKNGKKKTLEFSDLRKFGKIVLVNTREVENLSEIKALGVDAMDRRFNLKKLEEILERKQKSQIGIVLMDQNLLAGIGNIYRSEILFEAGVDPRRKVSDLKPKEVEGIFKQIKKILRKAIKMRGTSDSDYRDTSGAPGGFQKILRVYRRDGQKCKKCDTIVERIKMGQRSVFYCPKCQK